MGILRVSTWGFVFMERLGMENVESGVPMRRSQADKVGKHKYEIQRLDRLDARMERMEWMLRTIFHGLGDYFHFEQPLVEKVACASEMDLAVVSLIFEAGSGGILAKDIVARLPQYSLEKHRVLRIIRRVNRNVEDTCSESYIKFGALARTE
ncbi:MAG: hypothetical protein WBV70_02870 [Candidatus Bathyarchaeia archaeon]